MSDAALTEAALERLYTRLERRVYNVVYRWVWDEQDARDVVQEAFLKVWRMRARVDMATVEPLLYRVAVNLAANKRRNKALWRMVGLGGPDDDDGAQGVDPAAPAAPDLELTRRVRAAVDALPERLRRVVVLCEFAELTYPEVARALGIPEGTVGSRRHQALALLRVRLADMMEGADEAA